MPVRTTKLANGKVRVSTPSGVKAKATTPAKAAAQKRLLNAVDHGFKPTGKAAKKNEARRAGGRLEAGAHCSRLCVAG